MPGPYPAPFLEINPRPTPPSPVSQYPAPFLDRGPTAPPNFSPTVADPVQATIQNIIGGGFGGGAGAGGGGGGLNVGGGFGFLDPALAAGNLNLSNVRGGLADWLSLALAPFSADMQRQQAASTVASIMGFFPNDFSQYGIPQTPQLSPPDWINQWLQGGVPPGSGPGGGFGGGALAPQPPTGGGGGGFTPGNHVAPTAGGWEVVINGSRVGPVYTDQSIAEQEFNRIMGL